MEPIALTTSGLESSQAGASSVCALVITFNRVAVLRQCVEILRSQTRRPDEIVVVDNGSTDGTSEWLRQQPDLTVLQQENSGVAGGIYSGLKYGYERGYSWIWINDDDAFPAPDALDKLMSATWLRPKGRVFNSLSRDISDCKRIAFHFIRYIGGNPLQRKRYDYVSDLLNEAEGPLIEGEAQFYQSSLLHREIIDKVGLPIPDLFIRGDEIEYLTRIIGAGFPTYTVPVSRVVHPQQKREVVRILGKRLDYEPMEDLKRYYTARNAVWSDLHFPGAWGRPSLRRFRILKIFIYHQLVASITHSGTRQKLAAARIVCHGIADGLRMNRDGRIRGRETGYRHPFLVRVAENVAGPVPPPIGQA